MKWKCLGGIKQTNVRGEAAPGCDNPSYVNKDSAIPGEELDMSPRLHCFSETSLIGKWKPRTVSAFTNFSHDKLEDGLDSLIFEPCRVKIWINHRRVSPRRAENGENENKVWQLLFAASWLSLCPETTTATATLNGDCWNKASNFNDAINGSRPDEIEIYGGISLLF